MLGGGGHGVYNLIFYEIKVVDFLGFLKKRTTFVVSDAIGANVYNFLSILDRASYK